MKRLVMLSLLIASPVLAVSPPRVPVQGFLTNVDGTPLEGNVSLAIALYDVDTAGTAFFSETQTVNIVGGLFSFEIGAQQTLDLAEFRDRDAVFLGIAVDGDTELSPRIPLATVPWAAYASFAGDAETLQGLGPEDFRNVNDAVPFDQVSGVPADLLDGDNDVDTLGALTCVTGEIPRRFGGAWLCDEAVHDVGCAPGLVLGGFDSAGAPICVPGTDEPTVDGFVADNGFVQANIGCPSGQVMNGIDAAGAPVCVVDRDTTFNGNDFAISGQTCPAGELMIGINSNGGINCSPINGIVRGYIEQNCFIYLGWRDGCEAGCTTVDKVGRVSENDCTNISGNGDNTCQTQTINGVSVRTFGLSFEGDVDDNDKLFVGLECL
jgi:hypothetical protein